MNRELHKLVKTLGNLGFEVAQTRYNPVRADIATAVFAKHTSYEEKDKNAVDGLPITVTIDYACELDHIHRKYDKNDELIKKYDPYTESYLCDYNTSKAGTYIDALLHSQTTSSKKSTRSRSSRSSGSRSSGSRSSRSKTRSKN